MLNNSLEWKKKLQEKVAKFCALVFVSPNFTDTINYIWVETHKSLRKVMKRLIMVISG